MECTLKKLGLRATPQRLAILKQLDGNTSHPSAEEIYQELKLIYPSLSLTTIYNTLESLIKAGQLQELKIDPERRRFDPNPKPHTHFICTACHRVFDLDSNQIKTPDLPAIIEDFLVEECTIDLTGLCPACKKIGLDQN